LPLRSSLGALEAGTRGPDAAISDFLTAMPEKRLPIINNYRSQFKRIIAKSSYDELVSRMRQKLSKTTEKMMVSAK